MARGKPDERMIDNEKIKGFGQLLNWLVAKFLQTPFLPDHLHARMSL